MSVAEELADLGRSFARYLRAANRSERTVVTYGEAIDQLAAHLDGLDDPPVLVSEIERSHVEGFLVALRDRGRSAATLNNRFRSLSV